VHKSRIIFKGVLHIFTYSGGVKDCAVKTIRAAILILLFLSIANAWAGPPFITDDPEPVEPQHWEVYLASESVRNAAGVSGTLPHVEINYGAAKDLQLHLILPYAWNEPSGGHTTRGYGDTELGVKYRFVQENAITPMVGVFPLIEIPTGDASAGLGSGRLSAFLPVWIQKSWGDWTSYGGGGYFINPGIGNRDYWLVGWEVQKDLNSKLTLGGELLGNTQSAISERGEIGINLGGQYNFDSGHHLLFSAGKSLHGDIGFMSYVAFQWTFGPPDVENRNQPKR
jgi:hypothetical protein